MAHPHKPARNELLAALAPQDQALLAPHLEPAEFHLRDVLVEAGQVITHVYFPRSGMSSILTDTAEGRIEVGIVGREGLIGLPILLGVDRGPHRHYVQGAGEALRIPSEALRRFMGQSPTLQAFLLRYVQTFLVQTAQTAFVNATHTLETRLARWVLMTHDRTDGDELVLTHEFLSLMLGVRRAGVTVATHILEGNGLIKATRGRITVLDRARLEELASDAYGMPEAEYARIMAPQRTDLDEVAPAAAGRPEPEKALVMAQG